MGLARRKPFLLLAGLFSIILLILACITTEQACYNQLGPLQYRSVTGDCSYQCTDEPALKIIINNYDPTLPGAKQIIRCAWRGITRSLFLASASLMCLWTAIELLLTTRRRFHIILNIFLIFTIALGAVTAGFMLADIHHSNCSDIRNRTNNPPPSPPYPASGNYSCYRTIFNVSFILQIIALILFCFQFFYNLIIRKKMNQEDPGYANVPQQTVQTDPLGGPTDRVSENRIM